MGDDMSLRDAVRELTADDVALLLSLLDGVERRALGQALGMVLKAGAPSRLVQSKLRSADGVHRDHAVEVLAAPVLDLLRRDLGDDRYADPTLDDLRQAMPVVVASFGPTVAQAVVAWLVEGDVPAVEPLRQVAGELADMTGPPSLAPDELAAVRAEVARRDRAGGDAGESTGGDAGDEEGDPAPPRPEPPAQPESEPEPEPAIEREPEPAPDETPLRMVEMLLGSDADRGEGVPRLFTPLDGWVLRSISAAHLNEAGAPDLADVRALVDEVVSLNTSRPSSYFHLGFLSALEGDDGAAVTGLTADRRQWYRFGRLSGLVQLGEPHRLVDECREHPGDVRAVVEDEAMGWDVTGPVVRAMVEHHPLDTAALLEGRNMPFADSATTLAAVFETSRRLLAARKVMEAEQLLASLRPYAGVGLVAADGDSDPALDLARRIASCRRAVDDFAGAAALLDRIDATSAGAADVSRLHAERGLIAARIGHLGHAAFPGDDHHAEQLAERLAAGAPEFEAAMGVAIEPRAALCLGLLAFCREDYASAAHRLEQASAAMHGDALYESALVADAARFHHGLSLLWGADEVVDGPAYSLMVHALDAGYHPPARSIALAAEGLAALSSRHTVPFLAHVRPLLGAPAPLAGAVKAAVEADRPGAAALAVELAAELRLQPTAQFDLLEQALAAAGRQSDVATATDAVERLEDVLVSAGSPDLEARWLDLLRDDEAVRSILGPLDCDLLRAHHLRILGRNAEAAGLVTQVFHRLVADPRPEYDVEDLVEMLGDLGEPDERVAPLRQQLSRDDDQIDETHVQQAVALAPIDVLFVGGNEVQARYEESISEEVERRFGGRVRITWEFTGWSPNWAPAAERVEAQFSPSAVLVLMQFVRTNLGRRLRRTAGENDVPWVACTGHGRAAIRRSILRAVDVAAARRVRSE